MNWELMLKYGEVGVRRVKVSAVIRLIRKSVRLVN